MYSVCAEIAHDLLGMKYKHCCYGSVAIPSTAALFCFLKFINNFDRSRSWPPPVFKPLTCFRACFSLCGNGSHPHSGRHESMDYNIQLFFGMPGSLM